MVKSLSSIYLLLILYVIGAECALTVKEKQELLDLHDTFRSELATGRVEDRTNTKLPAAADMKALVCFGM